MSPSLPHPDSFTFGPSTLTSQKGQSSWRIPCLSNPIPHRLQRKIRSRLRARQSPASSITALQTSFSPYQSLRALRKHKWSIYDAQFLFLIILAVFSLCITPTPGPIEKTAAVALLILLLLMPATRQFFLPFLPIGTWLLFFFSCRFIAAEYRPPIWVRVLPALENIFYGANLSNILSAHQHVVLDVLAWLPYGITHFGAPFVCSAVFFIFGAPGTTPVFARTFGFMNITGVLIQILFPCSPPWYENMYGLAPANYSMEGSPAGLARIDRLFGFDLYTSNFTASPLVFGAFPSLHSGNAVLQALFMSHLFPKLRPLFIAYAMWLWWATMYLSHHYAVDLVGGGLIAAAFFYYSKANFLPRQQPDKKLRWDYDYVEVGEAPENMGNYEYGLADLDRFGHARGSSDEWTMGSSSSVSSGSRSPATEDAGSVWDGETLASDGEKDVESFKNVR
ncbi:MAG: Aureobasidin resistance protein Aur1 [Claussenomyces sp. TS43310]|nr:MAG: Aureobasidin resistance protein Aur1 [Claussenomyces sp. TS43310]